jgi:short-subunit dehydrogenase
VAVKRLALVTGASAGIGAAFARAYAERGFDVAITARRADRLADLAAELEGLHDARAIAIEADLARPGAVDLVLAGLGGADVDVLVNNAGYGLPGTWARTSWNAQADVLQVMLTAPLELAHKILPGMIQRRWGRIVNVSSLAGFAPVGRGHTTYGPIKAALTKFTQALNLELQGTGVHATAACPGMTRSEFHDVNGARSRVEKLPSWMWQTAETVAALAIAASERNQAVIVTGAPNKLIAGLSKAMPDGLTQALARGQMVKYRGAAD